FPDAVPLLEQQESFARLLRRATHRDPGRRFGSAGEMAEQLTGVLREVLATADGVPRSAFSTVFSPELQAIGTGDDAAGGPEAALAGAVAGDAAVPAEVASSAETRLALARAQLDVGDYNGAGATLADLA